MNITTDLTDFEEIYDAVQTGEISRPDGSAPKMGDTINGTIIMVNSFHLAPIPDDGKPLFIFTTQCTNHSTKHSFSDSYIDNAEPTAASYPAHVELVSFTSTPITTDY